MTATAVDAPAFSGQIWAPTEYTPPLSTPILSDGYRLIQLVERHFRGDSGHLIRLDDWQKALLIHALERFPLDWPDRDLAGRLRYRQLVISMGRQNGKSIIGGVLGIYGLLQHVRGPRVVGIATDVEKANIVYNRVRHAITSDPALSRRLKTTGTRGITHRGAAGIYRVQPAKAEGVQGEPVTLAVADELHLMLPIMWDSIVLGQRAQRDALVAGITTAGDEGSELLTRLYDRGRQAIAGGDDLRYGFFHWTSPAGSTIDTPGAVEAANPAVACGRIPLTTVLDDIKGSPEADQIRYTLNRFVSGTADQWVPVADWRAAGRELVELDAALTFGMAITHDRHHLTINAAARDPLDPEKLNLELVATLARYSPTRALEIVDQLAARHPRAAWVVDSTLSDLAALIKDRGHTIRILTHRETSAAAASFRAIVPHRLDHDHNQLLTRQIPHARLGKGEAPRLKHAGHPIDAVDAAIYATHIAAATQPTAPQLF